jgi:hypothetical protein
VRRYTTVLLIALLAVALVVGACGKKDETTTSATTAPAMSAQDIIKKANEAGASITSVKSTSDISLTFDTTGSGSPDATTQMMTQGPIKVTTDVTSQSEPMAFDGTAGVTFAGQTLSLGMKVVDSKAYIDYLGTWYETPPEAMSQVQTVSPSGKLDWSTVSSTLQSMGVDPTTWASELTVVGTEQIDGATCYHVKLVVDPAKAMDDVIKILQDPKFQELLGSDQAQQLEQLGGLSATDMEQIRKILTSAQADMWVDSTSFYIRKATMNAKLNLGDAAAADGVGGMGLDVTMAQSNFNEPVTVTAPENPKSADELTKAMGGLLGGGSGTGL